MSSTRVGACVMPISAGTEKPYTSASTMPTRSPWAARAQARLTVTRGLAHPALAAGHGVDLGQRARAR